MGVEVGTWMVKVSRQATGVAVGWVVAAAGRLEGMLGATGDCLN